MGSKMMLIPSDFMSRAAVRTRTAHQPGLLTAQDTLSNLWAAIFKTKCSGLVAQLCC